MYDTSNFTVSARRGIIKQTHVAMEGAPRSAVATPLLRLGLFGRMQALNSAGQNILPRTRKTRAVLAALSLAGSRPLLRTYLTGLLWSRRGKRQAQASLRQCIHELQQTVAHCAAGVLQAHRHHLVLLDNRLWVDVLALTQATIAQPEGLGFFQSTLLDDLAGLDPAFDRWRAEVHQRTAQFARSVAESVLAAQYETDATIDAAEQLLRIDSFHEGAWQTLIRAHVERGDRAAAIAAFEQCTMVLANAGLTPSIDTEELVRGARRARQLDPEQPILPGLIEGGNPAGQTGLARQRCSTGGVRLAILPPRPLDRNSQDNLPLGLAEEITIALANFRWISCIASTSLAAFDSHPKLTDRQWQQLDVDFMLDSTIQRTANQVRIISRLLDVRAGGKVVWARRFDRTTTDVLTLQEEIAAETAAQLDPELILREAERAALRGSNDTTPYDLILRAIPAIYRLEPVGFRVAGNLLAAASAADPGNAVAHVWWAYWHLFLLGQGWAEDPASATLRAGELAARAVTLDPRDARALTLVGHIRGFLHKRTEEARDLHERALLLNPSLPLAWCFSGLSHCYAGSHEAAIQQITQALRLSPHDPHGFFFNAALMMPHFLRCEYQTAAAIGQRAIELNPDCSSTYKGYLATLGHLQRDDDAAAVHARLLELEPGFSISSAIERSPLRCKEDLALYAEGLRRAGLREG